MPVIAAVRPAPTVPRWATWAAHAVPLCVLPSGLWRIGAWFTLLPGSTRAGGIDWASGGYILGLSVVSEGLALLTLGLVRPWGEMVPSWVPLLGGRPVDVRAAMIPAVFGIAALTAIYAYGFLNYFVFHVHFGAAIGSSHDATLPTHGPALWLLVAAYVPLLGWPTLLAAVTVAYYRRRTSAAGTVRRAGAIRNGRPGRRHTRPSLRSPLRRAPRPAPSRRAR